MRHVERVEAERAAVQHAAARKGKEQAGGQTRHHGASASGQEHPDDLPSRGAQRETHADFEAG
jgi:hypothetical protein